MKYLKETISEYKAVNILTLERVEFKLRYNERINAGRRNVIFIFSQKK